MENQTVQVSPLVTSEKITEITKALLLAQKDIKHAQKDGTNDHTRKSYATLESVIDAIKDALLKNNVLVIQATDGKQLTTRLQHNSGEFIQSTMVLSIERAGSQGMGSAITYARRYSLTSMLSISQADDDGNASTKNKPTTKTVAKATPEEKKASVF